MQSSDLQIPGYLVKQKLGQGAMAQVYLAEQIALERDVALKVMAEALLSDPEFSERFLREAKIIAQLAHPNIISIYDVGNYKGCHYLSMEYHSGGDLKRKIQSGISLEEAIAIVTQIAKALSFAHSHSYVHRDVKPENILFSRSGAAILTDFGIARSGDATSSMTAVGTVMGTPKYMSPEQAKGENADGRSDTYSLGVIFYELLTGEAPYRAENPLAICQMHVTKPVPVLPKSLDIFQPVIDGCMAKDPDDRFDNPEKICGKLNSIMRQIADAQTEKLSNSTQVPLHSANQPVFSDANRAIDPAAANEYQTQDYNVFDATPLQRDKALKRHSNRKGANGLSMLIVGAAVVLLAVIGLKVVLTNYSQQDANNKAATIPGNEDAIDLNSRQVTLLPESQNRSTEAAATPQTVSQSAQTPTNPQSKLSVLLNSVKIVAPQTKSLCASSNPYLLGKRLISENDSLRNGECFSIEVSRASVDTEVLVFSHSQNGTIYRLLPNACNAMGLKDQANSVVLEFPLDSKKRLAVINLDENPGREWIYAIGVKGENARNSVLQRFNVASDVCNQDGGGNLNVEAAQAELRRLSSEFAGQIEWIGKSFQHNVL